MRDTELLEPKCIANMWEAFWNFIIQRVQLNFQILFLIQLFDKI